MEKVLNILIEYRSKGVRIGLDHKGMNLSIKGNVAGLNDADKQALRDNKELLIDFLKNQRSIKIPSTPLNDGRKLPLSPNQKSIWLHARMEEDDTMYLIPFVHDLNIPSLDKEQLCLATEKLVQEHRILSFVFREEQGEMYQQPVDFVVSNHLLFEDLSTLPLIQRKEVFEKAVQQSMQEGFNFMDQAPWSITVFDFGDDNYSFFLKIHHLIADGSTLSLLVENLVDSYKTQVSGGIYKNQGIQYHDYLNWISNKDHQKQSSEFWKTYLNNRSDDFQFYLTEDIVEEAVSLLIDLKLSSSLTSDIDAFSKGNNVSVSHLFSFAFGFVLSKYGRTEDLILGTPVEGRSRPELTRVIGDLVNTLPLRLKLNYKQSIRENLSTFGKGFLSILEHQLYPLEYILDDINYERRQNEFPLFNTMVSFPNNQELGARNENEIQFGKEKALYDLTLSVLQLKNGIDLQLEFDSGKFSKTFVSNILDQTIIVLHQILQNPDGALTDVSLIGENEREAYLKAGLPHAEVKLEYTSALVPFKEKVKQTPQAIAIVEGERSITYLELNQFSKSIAAKLQKEGIAKGDKIAVELPSGLNLISSMLGIWAIGAVYVPLGTQFPQSRKEEIIEDCGAVCCIDDAFLSSLTTETPVEVINDSSDVAYILYTSGSTGKPKGVVISHGALAAKMEEELELVKLDPIITLTFTSPSFDVSFLELLLPLFAGGSVVICEDKSNEDIYKLIIDHGVTILQGTPTYFSHFESELNEDVSQLNSTLKLLCIGGESLNDVLVKRLKKKLPNVRVNNHYGPTEITIDALVKQDVSEFKRNSLGKPFGNTGAIITDDYYNVLPEFVPGELSITGPSLAEGYWNLETETEQKFVKSSKIETKIYRTGDLTIWTPNGEVEFIGRIDKQVKYRGFRIELEEVSARLRGIKDVEDAYTGIINNVLVSWVVSENIKSDKFQSELKNSLPDYMIPAVFEEVSFLPMNLNGKVDENQLPKPKNLGSEFVAPRNELEEQLCEIWQEVLGVEKVGVYDNFFELGGNSLKMMRVRNLYHKNMGVQVSLKSLFEKSTIAKHADELESLASSQFDEIPKVGEQESYPMSDGQRRIWLLSQFDESSVTYNMPFTTQLSEELQLEEFEQSIYDTVDHFEILRTVFKIKDTEVAEQHVLTREALNFRVERLKELDLGCSIEEFIQKDASKVFDLENGPLIRAYFILTRDDKRVLHLNMHHIICDAESFDTLYQTIDAYYKAHVSGSEKPKRPRIQYKDYTVWHSDWMHLKRYENHRNFWHTILENKAPRVDLPQMKARPKRKTFIGREIGTFLKKEMYSKIHDFTSKKGASSFIFFLASMNALLYRYTGKKTTTIGTSIDGRTHADLSDQVGFFINALALKTTLSGEQNFNDYFDFVKKEVTSMYDFQSYPFDVLVEELEENFDPSRSPFFDMRLTVNGSSRQPQEAAGKMHMLGDAVAKLDLSLILEDTGEYFFALINYNSDVYEEETIASFLSHYSELISSVLNDPNQKIDDLIFFDPEEIDNIQFDQLPEQTQRDLSNRLSLEPDTLLNIVDMNGALLPLGAQGRLTTPNNRETDLLEDERVALMPDNSIKFFSKATFEREGLRIEGYELSTVLVGINQVEEFVILPHPQDANEYVLIVAPKEELESSKGLEHEIVQAFSDAKAPRYMIILESIPRKENGTWDKKELSKLSLGAKRLDIAKEYPKTELEIRVVKVLEQVLETSEVAMDSSFFEIGGNSIKASMVIARIHKEFNVRIDIVDFFLNPTLRFFVGEIEKSALQEANYDESNVIKKVTI